MIVPIRLIGVEGYSVTLSAMVMMALSLPMLIVPYLTALSAKRVAHDLLSSGGLVVAAGGLLWLSTLHPGASLLTLSAALILVGIGAAIPWGLMDALSVSVVAKERAGMASGLFSTVRVAGEGITIAVISTVFVALIASYFKAMLSTTHAAPLIDAARQLAGGDIAAAQTLLPAFSHQTFIQLYGDAFHNVLLILPQLRHHYIKIS